MRSFVRALCLTAAATIAIAIGTGRAQSAPAGYEDVSLYACPILTKTFGTDRYAGIIGPAVNYIEGRPFVAEKLGSACNIADHIRAECRRNPRRTIGEAVDALIDKVSRRVRLPDVPRCGA